MKLTTVLAGCATTAALTACAISIRNRAVMPRLHIDGPQSQAPQRVSVLIPVRNEQENLLRNLATIATQAGVDELLLLDDDSGDNSAAIAQALFTAYPHARVIDGGSDLPAGWLGKNWACHRLFQASNCDVAIFIDADVSLAPGAISTAVGMLNDLQLDLLSPYPQQQCGTVLARAVQPLLQWSWMSTIPWRYSLISQRPSMAVANGQFMLVRRDAYRQAGGHEAVKAEVIEDVALARSFRRAGLRTAVVDGSNAAQCHMYAYDSELIDGYTKSLWAAFGEPPGSYATVAALLGIYLGPLAALGFGRCPTTKALGALGCAAAVVNRIVVAYTTGQRVFPDSLGQPLSIAALAALFIRSQRAHKRGTLCWKGRQLPLA